QYSPLRPNPAWMSTGSGVPTAARTSRPRSGNRSPRCGRASRPPAAAQGGAEAAGVERAQPAPLARRAHRRPGAGDGLVDVGEGDVVDGDVVGPEPGRLGAHP